MRLRKYKPMMRPDGIRRNIRILQCQHVENGRQCERSLYERGKCYEHFQDSLRSTSIGDVKP
jgi:hypothetical protein